MKATAGLREDSPSREASEASEADALEQPRSVNWAELTSGPPHRIAISCPGSPRQLSAPVTHEGAGHSVQPEPPEVRYPLRDSFAELRHEEKKGGLTCPRLTLHHSPSYQRLRFPSEPAYDTLFGR